MDLQTLLTTLKSGSFDHDLAPIYAPSGEQSALNTARLRAIHVVEAFAEHFSPDAARAALFSGPVY